MEFITVSRRSMPVRYEQAAFDVVNEQLRAWRSTKREILRMGEEVLPIYGFTSYEEFENYFLLEITKLRFKLVEMQFVNKKWNIKKVKQQRAFKKKVRISNFFHDNIYDVLKQDKLPVQKKFEDETACPMWKYYVALWDDYNTLRQEMRKSKRKYDHSNILIGPLRPEVPPPERNAVLLATLRDHIDHLRACRCDRPYIKWSIITNVNKYLYQNWTAFKRLFAPIEEGIEMQEYIHHPIYPTLAMPEMESDSHGEGTVTSIKHSNVILTENREGSEEITASFQSRTWTDLCSSEEIQNYSQNVDRWILIDTFSWSTGYMQDHMMASYQLPYQMIKSEPVTPCRMPNTLPFTIHRYWRGDLEVKIHINANKFQIGSLQASWLYSPDFDTNIAQRRNIWSLSQAPHIIINSATSNEATMIIPYKYYLPYIHTKPRGDMPDPPLNMGSLYIRVLNPLTTSANGPTDANVSIFVRSFNNEFTGMLAGDLDKIETVVAKPEMDRMIDIASSLLTNLHPDNNRDNPPVVNPPQSFVPTASHSWAVGTNLPEPLHPLRLDGKGQTPHPPGIEIEDAMSIKKIVQTFGLLTTVSWSKDQGKETFIFTTDVSPLNRKHLKVWSARSDTELRTFAVPPVGVVSSMFYGWRGTLEYRFDIVASQFHTGRLMVAYIPGVTSESNITFSHLRASTNMIFSLQESDQFTFKVPFISNKPYWPREYAGDYDLQNVAGPSFLALAIVNPLIPMQTVSDKVYINVYVRGGDDFEVVVPVQPALGLCWNSKFLTYEPEYTKIKALDGYYPYYIGRFEDLTYACVFRWNTTAHTIAQFNFANEGDPATREVTYCKVANPQAVNLKYWNNVAFAYCEYAVFINEPDLGYIVGIPVVSQQDAYALAYNIQILKLPLNDARNQNFCIKNTWSTVDNEYCIGNPEWDIIKQRIPGARAEGERQEAGQIMSMGTVSSTSFGFNLYGERFFSLKDLCRRYQLYGHYNISTFNVNTQEYVKLRFPVLPQGLPLQVGINKNNIFEIWNRGRDGHIPLIASGYRFYRGSVRFRLVCDTLKKGSVIVQHRPDRRLRYLNMQQEDSDITGNSVINHSYASYIQLTHINGLIEFEVPFYQLGMYGFLQGVSNNDKTEASNFFSLGEICVSMAFNTSDISAIKNVLATVYYCIGDDMTFSTFQGFPPMLYASDVPHGVKPSNVEEDFHIVHAAPEIFGVKSMVNYTGENLESHLKNVVSDAIVKLEPMQKEMLAAMETGSNTAIVSMILECLHLTQSSTPYTIALVIINVLIQLKIIFVSNILSIVRSLADVIKRWCSRSSGESISDDTKLPSASAESLTSTFDVKEWSAFVGILFVGVTTALNVTCKTPSNLTLLAKSMSSHISMGARNFSFVSTFITGIIEITRKIVRYVVKIVYPLDSWYYDMELDDEEIKMWVDEVLYLTSFNLVDKLDEDGYLYDRIYAAMLTGREIAVKYCTEKTSSINIIFRVLDKINNLYEEAVSLGKHPYVRKEPFCVWVYGEPGIGKSYVTEFLTTELLKANNIKFNGPKIFTVMPSTEYWNTCRAQPVLVLDDAFAVEMGTTLEKQLNAMYMVKSSCALNPNMADLKDKQLRYNPEIFYINSNKAFLNIAGVDPAAIHRRRDVLLNARLIPGTSMKDYSQAQLHRFEHLQFSFHSNPNLATADWGAYMTYADMVKIITERYKTFYANELDNYRMRLATYDAMLEEDMGDDDIMHTLSLQEVVANKRQKIRQKYFEDMSNSLFSKFKSWTGDLTQIFKDKVQFEKVKNYCGKYLSREYGLMHAEIKPEMFLSNIFNRKQVPTASVHDSDQSHSLIKKEVNNDIEEVRKQEENVLLARKKYECVRSMRTGFDNSLIKLADWCDGVESCSDNANCLVHPLPDVDNQIKLQFNGIMTQWFTLNNISIEDQRWFTEHFAESDSPGFIPKIFVDNLHRFLLLQKVKGDCKVWFYNALMKCFKIVVPGVSIRTANIYCWHSKVDSMTSWIYCSKKETWSVFDANKKKWVENPQCIGYCYMHVSLFKHLWYYTWLKSNTKLFYQYKKKIVVDLPTYFHADNTGLELHAEVAKYFDSRKGAFLSWLKYNMCPTAISFLKNITMAALAVTSITLLWTAYDWLLEMLGFSTPIAKLTGAVGVKVITDSVVNKITSRQIGLAEGAYSHPHIKVQRIKTEVNAKPLRLTKHEMAPQQAMNVITAIQNNSIMLIIRYTNAQGIFSTVKARCLGVYGNNVLAIKHYYDEFKAIVDSHNDAKVYVRRVVKSEMMPEVGIDFKNIKVAGFSYDGNPYNTNFMLILMPPHIPLFRDIRNLFAPIKYHQAVGPVFKLYTFGVGIVEDLSNRGLTPVKIDGTENISAIDVEYAYAYPKHGAGMCGSVLISNNLDQSPIIGMHVAGAGGLGYSEVIYREMFTIPIELDESVPYDSEPLELSTAAPEIKLDTTLMIYGTVSEAYKHRETGKTALIPSDIHGVFDVRTQPNPLHRLDKRLPPGSDPMKAGCEKHGRPVKQFDPNNVKIVANDMFGVIMSSVKPLRQPIGMLSEEMAIVGDCMLPHYEPLDWNTSPGYGYKDRKGKGKAYLFETMDTPVGKLCLGINEPLRSILDHKQELREQGIVPVTIFTDCLKDTTMPIEKCKIPGKTRIFSISPVDFTIQFRQYFGDFIAAYTAARFDAEHAIGINVDSEEWSELYHRITLKQQNFIAGDYSNFGPGLSLQLADAVLNLIIDWYKFYGVVSEHLNVMRVMKYEILCSKHLCLNLVYSVFGGIPSGSPITTPLNSLVNCLYIRLMWLDIMKNTEFYSMEHFNNNVTIITYGDDMIGSVSDLVKDEFNMLTLANAFARYDIIFTDAAKTGKITPFVTRNELSFLSRYFVPHPTRRAMYIAGLKKISIESTANWITKSGCHREASLTNSRMCLESAYGWGELYYSYIADTLRKAWIERGYNFNCPLWIEKDERIFENKTINDGDYMLLLYNDKI
ncbi:hypothetical protein [Hubei coleoptera virus 1]|uniref:hypothetical protein n=1 Tax=Hubei coleoptera virus 1 TaxID=1922860 RepID=UPI0009098E01|nr:hypothetical protein [Hubei coleoptera virus 1]APG77956.1 hypothetical protein [Hubei coleoptera virus 1]